MGLDRMARVSLGRPAAVLVLALLAGGCGGGRSVVVEPTPGGARPARSVQPAGGQYLVVRGDTLYQIAFRHGLDYRDLARWNRIGPPYTIYPGQRIRLSPDGRGAGAAPARTASGPAPAPERPQPAPTRAPVTATPTPATPAKPVAPPPARPAAARTAPAAGTAQLRWQWPADGELIGRFASGDPTRQGIDIGGRPGTPVRAAADGEVVYSGAGLVGYGELIIVKHSDAWLSAYAHNRKRLVNEGERVRAGQQIAEMGRSGASRDMLHFEVRRNGKPVDPLGVLPKR